MTNHAGPTHRFRALLSFVVFVVAGMVGSTGTRIKTPFQVVPLWSDEMMSYLTGARQVPCSGPARAGCARIATGVCDGTAYFTAGQPTSELLSVDLFHPPSRQTESPEPQYFALRIDNAGSSMNLGTFVSASDLDHLELVFDCSFSGNGACPANRFQTGDVRRVELGPLIGPQVAAARAAEAMPDGPVDLTGNASVRPEGPIVVRIGSALRQSLFDHPGAIYQVRVVAECFSVAPTVAEWTLPLYESPSAGARSSGTVVARVKPGDGITFTYRSPSGEDMTFEPDWTEPDWGYTFRMDQTVLDQEGEWFQLPPRPFPKAVWIRLPGGGAGRLSAGTVYTLSRTIKASRKGTSRSATFPAGTNIVIVSVQANALEIRAEEPFDGPCTGDDRRPPRRKLRTYVVDAEAFYDEDLHLQLRPAYTRGC